MFLIVTYPGFSANIIKYILWFVLDSKLCDECIDFTFFFLSVYTVNNWQIFIDLQFGRWFLRFLIKKIELSLNFREVNINNKTNKN